MSRAPDSAGLCICVLGCRSDSAALARRAAAGVAIWEARRAALVMGCGGRAWGGRVEADAIADILRAGGVPNDAIVRERCSFDTRDNARFAAALLRRRGIRSVVVVTCSWHVPRAARLFRAAGLDVEEAGVDPPDATTARRAYWWMREMLTSWKDAKRPMRIP